MPGLGTTPDESGLKSPSGGAVHSPGIHARAKVGVATRLRTLQTSSKAPRRVLPGLGLLLLFGLGCRGEKRATPTASRQAHRPAVAAPALRCDGASVLKIAVQPGDYLHAVADQAVQDVTLTLFDSGGRQLLKVDSLTAKAAPPLPAEEIHWVADAPGELRIELTPTGFRGPCGLRLAEHRRATEADRRRAAAEAGLAHAHQLRLTRKAETCHAGIAPYESAQRGFAALGLPRRRAEALLGLGLLQRYCLQDNKAALQVFARAEPLVAGDPVFEALVLQHLGDIRYALGDLDGA